MKAIIGIDTSNNYRPAIDLLARLGFAQPSVTLLHAANTACPMQGVDAHVEAEYVKVVQNLGLAALDLAIDHACGLDLKPKSKLVFGRAADALILEATQGDADLLAVCATHSNRWNSTFLGSATCALAIGSPISLLVAKGQIKRGKSLTAVVATDHSPSSHSWIRQFFDLKPHGIKHVHIVSAFGVDDETAFASNKNLAMLGGDVKRWLQETIEEKNAALVEEFVNAGIQATATAVEMDAPNAIHHAMEEFHADILVIGSHGNTNIPGTQIGSVALHEIIAEPYPVLMLRSRA